MDKKILFLVMLGVLILPSACFAQLKSCPVSGPCITSITPMIHKVEMTAGLIFGAVAVICFLVAGVLFLTAAGDPGKLTIARAAFIWGIVGVVVGILAFSIIEIILRVIA